MDVLLTILAAKLPLAENINHRNAAFVGVCR